MLTRSKSGVRARAHSLLHLFTSLAVCAAAAGPARAADSTAAVNDDLQRAVSLDRPAARIVSLAPHLTELVHSAGAGGKLVGVSRHCDYPPSVAQLPKVSDHVTFNYELISKLEPDLVLVWKAGLKDAALRKLVSLYRNVYVSNPTGFTGIAENVAEIGALTGNATQAQRAAGAFLREINGLAARYARPQPVKTLYLLWHDPPMTIGGNHWISRTLGLCGGVNVFADAFTDVVRLNRESLQLTQADVVLHSLKDYSDPNRSAVFGKALGPAASKTPVFYVESDLIRRPSLRLAQSAMQLCRLIRQAAAVAEHDTANSR